MGLGGLFTRMGSALKNTFSGAAKVAKHVGGKVWNGVKYLGKAAKPVIKVVKTVAGLGQYIPGGIGDVFGLIDKGLGKLNEYIDLIPDSQLKDKLKDLSGDASKYKDNIRGIVDDKGKKVGEIIDRAKPWIESGEKIIDKMSGK
jgi:hypothetical protein